AVSMVWVASMACSISSSLIALTPPLCSIFISRGTSKAQIFMYAAGCCLRTFSIAAAPCFLKSAARASKKSLLNDLRVASKEPPGFPPAELSAKRLELLRELAPGTVRVAMLVDSAYRMVAETTSRDVDAAARAMGLQIQVRHASTSSEIDAAFAGFARERPDALFVTASPIFNDRRVQLALQTMLHKIPATYPFRDFPEYGGLMSYGASLRDAIRQAGVYTGRILKGAKPAELPVLQSTKLELVINHQTARMLGLTVPDKLLVAADEVIE